MRKPCWWQPPAPVPRPAAAVGRLQLLADAMVNLTMIESDTTKRTAGDGSVLWCGRFVLHIRHRCQGRDWLGHFIRLSCIGVEQYETGIQLVAHSLSLSVEWKFCKQFD